jgi:hypothetical protein
MTSQAPIPTSPVNDTLPRWIGGVVGAAIGLTAYWLAMQRGVDIAIAVAAGMAIGVSRGSRRRSVTWAVGTAIAAPIAVLLTVWWFRAFRADPSLLYFLANVAELPRQVVISTGAAAFVGAWFGQGRNRIARK